MRQFEAGLPRLNRLARYYEGRHDVLLRTRLPGLPNNRLVHAFPRYIAQVSAAYLMGGPVRVEGPQGTERLRALLRRGAAGDADATLAVHQSVYGRAVSLCYEDAQGAPMVCALDPRNAFVACADTVDHRPLFGVYLRNGPAGREITVYTDAAAITWGPKGEARSSPHPFRCVPMAEYLSGGDGHGDFEDVLALVDAYDLLECDRVNDRQQFSDALLVLTGVMGVTAREGDPMGAMERLRQEKTLALPDSDAKAEWLVKNPTERDIEVLRAALAEDIHKFSLTPDFSDERFAGNASGIAIKYKLFNFDNRIKLKERHFAAGLRERARALCGWMRTREGIDLDADALTFRLTRTLPVNEGERARTIAALAGVVPAETLRYHSPLQDDPDTERTTDG